MVLALLAGEHIHQEEIDTDLRDCDNHRLHHLGRAFVHEIGAEYRGQWRRREEGRPHQPQLVKELYPNFVDVLTRDRNLSLDPRITRNVLLNFTHLFSKLPIRHIL